MTLTLDGVTRTDAGGTILAPTTLTLAPGTMTVLLGPTLAGKTSLMRVMAGLDRPTSGRVLWNGADVTAARVQDRGVAMVYQQFINYPGLSVFENIASPLRLQRRSPADIDRAVREVAEMLHLGPHLAKRPGQLSGGQQQRCALARALVKQAGLVLLDEPLANLDYKLREELRAELPRIFRASGAIFVYATTEPHEALLLGGDTATLWQGRVTQVGPGAQVYRQPNCATTARVFSDPPMNFITLAKLGPRLVLGGGHSVEAAGPLRDLADGRYLAGFRPNHLGLGPGPGLGFTARVAAVEITGSESYVHLDHGADRWIALAHGVHEPGLGTDLALHLDPAEVYLFAPEGGALIAAATAARAA